MVAECGQDITGNSHNVNRSDWQAETQKRRQARIAETCAKMESSFERFRDPDWTEMYVDDERRYIYCLISKASCTSWKATLLMLTGKVVSWSLVVSTS